MLPPLRAQGDTPVSGGQPEELVDGGLELRSPVAGVSPAGSPGGGNRLPPGEEDKEFQVVQENSGACEGAKKDNSCLVWLGSPPASHSKGDSSTDYLDSRGRAHLARGGQGGGDSEGTPTGLELHGSGRGERAVGMYRLSSPFKGGMDASFTFEGVMSMDAAESSTAASSSQPARSLFSGGANGGACSLSPSVLSPMNQCGSWHHPPPVGTFMNFSSGTHAEDQGEGRHGQADLGSTRTDRESPNSVRTLKGSTDSAAASSSVVGFGFTAAAAAAAAALGFGPRSGEQQGDIECSSSRLSSSSGSEFVADELEDETSSQEGKGTLTAAVFPVASTASSLQEADTPQLHPVTVEPPAIPKTNVEQDVETPRRACGAISGDFQLTGTGKVRCRADRVDQCSSAGLPVLIFLALAVVLLRLETRVRAAPRGRKRGGRVTRRVAVHVVTGDVAPSVRRASSRVWRPSS